MTIHSFLKNHGRRALVGAVVLTFATMTFSGCSAGSAVGGASSSAASESSSENMPISSGAASSENLSDARNTPAVRAAKAIGPTVVGITNKAVARDFFDNPVETEGVGSGVIFRKDGYIVTNNHVVDGAKQLIVSLPSGKTLKAKLVGTDAVTDLAVVKVDADDLPVAAFGDSDKIVVGEPAVAIGNPMGLEFQGSVTSGVISALNRTLKISDREPEAHPDGRGHQPGQLGRRARECGRAGHRHQQREGRRERRRGHGLRHPDQYRARGGRPDHGEGLCRASVHRRVGLRSGDGRPATAMSSTSTRASMCSASISTARPARQA
jgi:serine protease Do